MLNWPWTALRCPCGWASLAFYSPAAWPLWYGGKIGTSSGRIFPTNTFLSCIISIYRIPHSPVQFHCYRRQILGKLGEAQGAFGGIYWKVGYQEFTGEIDFSKDFVLSCRQREIFWIGKRNHFGIELGERAPQNFFYDCGGQGCCIISVYRGVRWKTSSAAGLSQRMLKN